MPRLAVLCVACALCVAPLGACVSRVYEMMDPEEVCEEVGYSIASRVFQCTGNSDLSDKRYRAFEARYRCTVESVAEPIDVYYDCPVKVNALSCESVAHFGPHLDRYLQASAVCAVILTRADGTPIPSGGDP